jgi:integrase
MKSNTISLGAGGTLINRLARLNLTTLPDGRHEDGLGLSLLVSNGGKNRSWTLRAKDAGGQTVNRGLGSLRKVDLDRARFLRDQMLALYAQAPEQEVPPSLPKAREMPTFLERAREVIATQTEGLRGKRPAYAWERTLLCYAEPLHDRRIDAITTADVMAVLKPIWLTKAPTARELQKHLAKLFSSAIADELIDRNPAAMADNLEHKLRKQKHRIRNHPAMPYVDVPAYVAKLEAAGTLGALALAFTILTCVRANEAYSARWDDIDADHVWTVRGKNGLFARIPLSAKAIDILRKVKVLAMEGRGDPACIFPGKQDGHISSYTMLKLLQQDHPQFTVHGFRSCFRTWGQEVTSIDSDTLEYCLHHIEGSRTEQAYMRGECLDKRRAALEQWANFVLPSKPNLRVVA